ncbi:hypothetical protein [Secundilactobacillus kimchicus]|uniref:hypothetical protein n=1 Tax=Secundilactobacillus kimchicus TaxID=528209 RepID=UPI002436C0D4|nr:hypothetical protein [Secundilactobacillus kimchicus]
MKMHRVGLTTQITIGMVGGIVFGLLFGPLATTVKILGDIFFTFNSNGSDSPHFRGGH